MFLTSLRATSFEDSNRQDQAEGCGLMNRLKIRAAGDRAKYDEPRSSIDRTGNTESDFAESALCKP